MQNQSIVLLLAMLFAISATSCTRSSSVEELKVGEDAALPMQAPGKSGTASDVMPVESMPDVKIDPSAEIPGDKDVTNIKVPEVKIDATESIGNIDETRVDGMDNTITEP